MDQNENPILQQVEQRVMQKVEPNMQAAAQRIIAAGMKVMFDSSTHALMIEQINKPGDLVENIGLGVATLMVLLYKESRGTMPIPAAVPAAVVLLCHAIDYLEKSGKLKATNEVVAQATQSMMAYLLQKMGITMDKLQRIGQAYQVAQQKGGV